MRQKKFRKITEKNIASIYGKMLTTIRRGTPSTLDGPHIVAHIYNPVCLSINAIITGPVNIHQNGDKSSSIEIVYTRIIDHIGVKLSLLYSPDNYAFNIVPGDMIYMTGSTIIVKRKGVVLAVMVFDKGENIK